MEKWSYVPCTNDKYEASTHGRVRRVRGRVLAQCPDGKGYPTVCIRFKGKFQNIAVHRLIGRTHLRYKRGLQINHKDGNKLNNLVTNLEYVTCVDNIRHAFRNKLINTKKPVIQLTHGGDVVYVWPSLSSVKAAGFNPGHVSSVCLGKRTSHKNYIWKYEREKGKNNPHSIYQ